MNKIVVAIPCLNEASTITKVVSDFRAAIPEAQVHVFDNSSSDGTAQLAAAAGATVHPVPFKGKGHVVRTIFRTINADGLILVDGDDTYPAEHGRQLLAPILAGAADMVVATRLERFSNDSFRPFHIVGNRLIRSAINMLFGVALTDTLSGYRAFSGRFTRTCPVLSRGFEIETELTVHAIERNMVINEMSVPYRERPSDSHSKLRTFRDGARVLLTILRIFRDFRPLLLFGSVGCTSILLGILIGLSVVHEFQELHRVAGTARAALSVGSCVFGAVCLTAGFTLDSVNRRMRELFTLLSDQVISQRGQL